STDDAEDTTGDDEELEESSATAGDDGIRIFDCWTRKWIGPDAPFLKGGAAIIHLRGNEALELAGSITFTVGYMDGSSESLKTPFKTRPKAEPVTQFIREAREKKNFNCIVREKFKRRVLVEIVGHNVGVSPCLFDELVNDGRMPKPIRIKSRVLWD